MSALSEQKCEQIASYLHHLDPGNVCRLEFKPQFTFSSADISLILHFLNELEPLYNGDPEFEPSIYLYPLAITGELLVYKDIFYFIEQIGVAMSGLMKVLEDYPHSYYYIVNKMISVLPEKHRHEYVSFKIENTVYEDIIGFDPSNMAVPVIKALIGLLENPVKDENAGQINQFAQIYNIISIKKGGE